MRTPLNAIIGMSDLLRVTQLSREQADMLQTLRSSSRVMLGLVEEVLDFSKIEAGKLVLERTDFDLHALVNSTCRILSSQAAAKGVEFVVSIMPEVPPSVRARYPSESFLPRPTLSSQRSLPSSETSTRGRSAGSRPSISGTQVPGPSNAVNWYRLDQIVDYLQPYSDGDQDELHRTMRPGLILTGFTGYQDHGKVLRHQLWHRLFHGHTGASLFWHYTALNADLTPRESVGFQFNGYPAVGSWLSYGLGTLADDLGREPWRGEGDGSH